MPPTIRTRRFRSVTAAAVVGAALLMGSALGLRGAPDAQSASSGGVPQATPRGRTSSCQGVVTSTVTTATIRVCDQTDIRARIEPLCTTCPAGVNVIFVVLRISHDPQWIRSEGFGVLDELQRWQDDPDLDSTIRVGVVRYDHEGSGTLLRPTESIHSARGALAGGWGVARCLLDFCECIPLGGNLNAAASEALRMLRDVHEAAGLGDDDRKCDFIVLFNESTFGDCSGFAMGPQARRQIAAARQLERDAGVMMVACPSSSEAHCEGAREMPANRRYFTQAPRVGQTRGFMRDELSKLENPRLLRSVELTQTLPVGLDFVLGSASEPPADVITSAAGTQLRWLWERLDAEVAHDVGYTVDPATTGSFTVTGSMNILDTGGRTRTIPMPDVNVVVADDCIPPPTETPTPTITPTPSRTPTATATATATPVPGSLFLPVALFESCDEQRRAADIAIVIDASTSMLEDIGSGRTKMAAALAAARRFLDALHLEDRDRAAIVQFNSEGRILQGLTHDRSALEAALTSIVVDQGTCLPCAIDVGEASLPHEAAARTRTIVLLTDGRSNPQPVSEAVARARQAKDNGVLIFTVGVGTELDVEALRQIASQERWFFQSVTADDLERIYLEIASLIPCPGGYWPESP